MSQSRSNWRKFLVLRTFSSPCRERSKLLYRNSCTMIYKWKEYHPTLRFFLMLCSNNVIERLFGNLRLKYRHSAINNLEIIFAARSLQLLSDMMVKHPEWFVKNRNVMERLSLDYSSPKEWKLDGLMLENVDIVSV